MKRLNLTPWFAAAIVALLAGCAQEQAPINRVQPDYFPKSFFVGQQYLDSSDDPEFYAQGTLVDVGYGAGQEGLFTSTYAQPVSRIKWSITEDHLIARLSYERVQDSDHKGVGGPIENGIVVASFKITKQFDVKRDYNAQTGEQSNVWVENDQDRPWSARDFIRVDWSSNEDTSNYDYDTLSMLGIIGGVTYTPLSYTVLDPSDPDAPHWDQQGGYLDVTTKAFAKPADLVDLSLFGLGEYPACFFDADVGNGTSPSTGCAPVELTIRHSFRVVPKDDYEPPDWDGYRFQAFGAFTTERYGYARDYGMTDTDWHRFIARYDIWQRAHFYSDMDGMTGSESCYTPDKTPFGQDPNRDLNLNGTEDECEKVTDMTGVGGSRCDKFSQKCTLPFRSRTPKTVVWYLASGSDQSYFEPTYDAALEWDVALRGAVMTARYAECVRTFAGTPTDAQAACLGQFPVYDGQMDDTQDAIDLTHEVQDCRTHKNGAYANVTDCKTVADTVGADRGYAPGVIALAKMDEMLVLCHSPVEQGDFAQCGSPRLTGDLTAAKCDAAFIAGDRPTMATCNQALTVRRGDLRYHQINALRAPQTPSPWGIMVDSVDPLNGKKIAASINVWTHVNDLWSQSVVDISRYINGELSEADITNGTYVHNWAQAAESKHGMMPSFTADQRDEFIAGMLNVSDAKSLTQQRSALRGSDIMRNAQKFYREKASTVAASATAPSSMAPIYEARRLRALNTDTEAALTTKNFQWLGMGGPSSGLAVAPAAVTALSSPLRGANPAVQRSIKQAKELAYAQRGMCMMSDTDADAPLGIAMLSQVLAQKFGDWQNGSNPNSTETVDQRIAREEKMRVYLARRAQYAVITHEMGHSIGLRHNFVSSSDAFNYRPQYWQLRTDDGRSVTPCTTLDKTGACTGPRYWDPETDNERQNLISMWMQSTTMDYAGETTQDQLGLGMYDFAAARMFYGDVVSVFKNVTTSTPNANLALDKMDNFGGLLGWTYNLNGPMGPTSMHYSQLQKNFGLISNCAEVDVTKWQPASWDANVKGSWNPTFDGLIVQVGGKFTRCRQQPVDYVNWSSMKTLSQTQGGNFSAANDIDAQNRIRVPYGFATDTWADLGNSAVYRHDNGADPYELFDFIITQQEVMHIFDNYRRNRQTFSVRTASNRQLERYNTKMRDSVKGLGLMANVYRTFLATGCSTQGDPCDFDTLWPSIAAEQFGDNILGAGLAFDHFSRQLATPEYGPHYLETKGDPQPILRSSTDPLGNPGATVLNVPNGATGYFGQVSWGGRPLENQLCQNCGEYNAEITENAGVYYTKAYTAMLLTESVDNFISATRTDFLDARYRSVSIADVFPDGYRRWLGNNLTGDDFIRGQRLAAAANGSPAVDNQKFPTSSMGYMQWWKPTPQICFPGDSSLDCTTSPAKTVAIEPQINWEQQKFLIAWTLMYLPENAKQSWLNQMGIWELGADNDPGFTNRIELHIPNGKVYIAKTFGKEQILGKTVQKGIAARMLEWGNQLVQAGYETTPGPDVDLDGSPDWYVPVIKNGAAVVKYDPAVLSGTPSGNQLTQGRAGCNSTDDSTCTTSSNLSAIQLENWSEVPFFMRQAMRDYGLADPSMKGLY